MCGSNFYVSDVIIVCTLMYQVDMQDKENVQVGKFLKKTLKVQDRTNVQGKFSGKSIIMQRENLFFSYYRNSSIKTVSVRTDF